MIRLLAMVIGIFSTGTLLTIALALGYVWMQGNITSTTFEDLRLVLNGGQLDRAEEEIEEATPTLSHEDILEQRLVGLAGIMDRELELQIIKESLDEQARKVLADSQALREQRDDFRSELENERNSINEAAMEQARGILLKMRTEAAVDKLLSLEAKQAILLVKGMPDKDAAKILEKFEGVPATQKAEEIFKAITRGEPELSAVDAAENQLASDPASIP